MPDQEIIAEMSFLRDLVQQAPGFVIVHLGRDHRFFLANKAFERLVGPRELIGLPVAEAVPEVTQQGISGLLDEVWETGTAQIGHRLPVFLNIAGKKQPVLRYVDFIHQPIKNKKGEMLGIYVQGNDVTEQKQAEDQLKIIAHESAHRVKNIIAIVNAVVVQSLRQADDLAAAEQAITKRLQAITSAQNAITGEMQEYTELRQIINDAMAIALATFNNITLEGPAVTLSDKNRLPLALTLHELTTNAIKYGALSTKEGRIRIYWEQTTDGIIDLYWQETGGPRIKKPEKTGFGTSLINRSLGVNPCNKVELWFKPEGVLCHMRLCSEN